MLLLHRLRLVLASLLLLASLLAVCPAPTFRLWYLAIVVTEAGFLAFLPGAILLLLPGGSSTRLGRISRVLFLLSFPLLFSPVWRASQVASSLPLRLDTAFGEGLPRSTPAVPARSLPWDATRWPRFSPPPGLLIKELRVPGVEGDIPVQVLRSGTTPGPLVLVIHGGSWRNGDETDLSPLDFRLAGQGYVVASLNYRLSPQWHHPAAVEDCQRVARHLLENAGEQGIDARMGMAVLGRSAGAHLGLLLAYTRPDLPIRGAIGFYGPYDLRWGWNHPASPWVLDSRGTLTDFIGSGLPEAGGAYDAASPYNHAKKGVPPTLLIHGERDELVRFAQSERLEKRLQEEGIPHLLLRMPWATHGCDYSPEGPCGQLSGYAVERFLGKVVPRGPSQGSR